ncbi:MAG: phosphoenolpyruvate--protein phosphotransferase [Candidatus Hydrogenedentota bacterium]|nr:MAG: phosphoenolpyruvate--protein phosphotransferase [Candidatus Hydrogenedentota bacterium]
MKEHRGRPISPGIAIAPLQLLRRSPVEFESRPIEPSSIEQEFERFENAVTAARIELLRLREKTEEEIGEQEAAIFDAHLMILEDPLLHMQVRKRLGERYRNVESILAEVVGELESSFASLDDPRMVERASDIVDVGERVLCHLQGRLPAELEIAEPVILVEPDMAPSTTALLDPEIIRGLVVGGGGETSHTAILARALGIPTVGISRDVLDAWRSGTPAVLDGSAGRVILDPSPEIREEYKKRAAERIAFQLELLHRSKLDTTTRDGEPVQVAANIEMPSEIGVARENAAAGIGLYRTEFLFMNRREPPDEEEQYHHYLVAAEAFPEEAVVIRTIDVGGDKFLSQADLSREMNPYLGLRAIRFSLHHPDLFRVQLRAILRAARETGNIRLMFPMVSCLEELTAALGHIGECAEELDLALEDIDVGIMVETPAAALRAGTFARYVEFFSIGTNDLVQYTMAAERGNEMLANLQYPFHPAILTLLERIVSAARATGIGCAVCGEAAGDLISLPLFLGAGIRELSVSPRRIPVVKEFIRSLEVAECEGVFREALECEFSSDVSKLLEERFREREARLRNAGAAVHSVAGARSFAGGNGEPLVEEQETERAFFGGGSEAGRGEGLIDRSPIEENPAP